MAWFCSLSSLNSVSPGFVDDYDVSDDGVINNADSDVIAADFKTVATELLTA